MKKKNKPKTTGKKCYKCGEKAVLDKAYRKGKIVPVCKNH